jgi:PAS domain S-box-containing protein
MVRIISLYLLVFLGVICSMSLAGSTAFGSSATPQNITVATTRSYSPFCFINDEQRPDGWLVDLWRLWSEKTGVVVDFVPAGFPKTIDLVKSGRVDAHAGLFYSKQRAEYLDFSSTLAKTETSIFFHKNIYGIKSVDDLAGFKVGLVAGDYIEQYLKTNSPKASLAAFQTNEQLFQAVKQGYIKVFACDAPVGRYYLKKHDLLASYTTNPPIPVYTNQYTAAVKKGNKALADLVYKGFSLISQDEYSKISVKWSTLGSDAGADVLSIAADRNNPPFSWLTSQGQPAGILIDIWRTWSTKTGKRISFIFGDQSKMIEYLKTGSAELHSGLFKSSDLQEILDYSLPLFPVEVSLFTTTKSRVSDLSEMAGKRIGVIFFSGNDLIVDHQLPQARVVGFTDHEDMLTQLASGELDGAVDISISVQSTLNRLGLSGQIVRHPEPLATRRLYAGIPKDRMELLNLVNSGLGGIPESELLGIEKLWVPNPEMRHFERLIRQFRLTKAEKDWLKKHPVVRLGIDPDWMPFEGFSSSGEYQGLSSSYVKTISQMLGVKMTAERYDSWSEAVAAARQGRIDLFPCLAPTRKGSEFLSFTRPYLQLPNVITTRDEHPMMSGLGNLSGKKVAVVKDFAVEDYIKTNHPGIIILEVKNPEQGLRSVLDGEATAYVDHLHTINYHIKKLGLKGLKTAATTKVNMELSMGVRKDWPELLNILEKALQSLTHEQHAKFTSQWYNLRFEDRIDWARITLWGGVSGGILALILVTVILWNRRLAKEVTRRSLAEDRFREMANSVPGALFQLRVLDNGERKYTYLNPQAEEFYGVSPEVVITEGLTLPFDVKDKQRVQKEITRSIGREAELNFVCSIKPPGASLKWVRVSAFPTRNQAGELIYNGFILDITKRKQAELEYLTSERKVKAMSQAVNDALIMLDSRGRVLFWNSAAERLFGYSEQEAMGMDFHTMAAPEKLHDQIKSGLKGFAQTGQGPVLGVITEITARNRKGDHFPVEVTLSSFQIDEQWYAVGMVRDITQRKQAEEDIRRSREEFRIIADYTYGWEGWHDKDGKLLWVNPAVERITGYSVAECMAMDDYPLPLICPEDHEIWNMSLRRALDGKAGNDVPFRVNAKNGEQYWIAMSWNPVWDEDGGFTGFRTSLRDFSERKEAEDQLRFTQYTVDKAVQTIFWIDPRSGGLTYVNDAACESLGYGREELLGMTVSQIDPDFPTGDLTGLASNLQRQKYIQTEGRHRTKDNRFLEVELSISTMVHDGQEMLVVYAKDISKQKQAERKLTESQYRLDMALEAGNLGTWDRSFVTDKTVVDERWAKLLGLDYRSVKYPFEEWINSIHPDDREIVLEAGRKYKEGLLPNYEVSYRVILDGQEERWHVTKGKAVERDEKGGILRMVGTMMDITEQKRAAMALEESEERSRLLLASAGEGIFGVDTGGRITFINPAALKMLGYEYEELHGKKVHDLIHHTRADGDPYDVQDCPMYASYTKGVHSRVDDEVLWRKDGGFFFIAYSSTPIRKDGQVMGAVVTFRDISAQKQADELLRQSQSRLDTALKASNTGLWDWRPLDGEHYLNDQWFIQLGYTREDFKPEEDPLEVLMHPDDMTKFKAALAEQSEFGQDSYKQEFRLKAKDGTWKWILSRGQVLERNGEGRMTRITGVHLDITERKKAEQELKNSRMRLYQIFDFLPDPTMVVDKDGRVIAWNRAIEEMTGINAKDMLGVGDYQYAKPFYGDARPLLIDLVQKWDESCLDDYEEIVPMESGMLYSESYHADLKGGTYLSAVARTLFNANGEADGAIEAIRDITEKKKSEQEIQEKLDELERFSRLVVGRELKMINLKEEINGLMTEMGKEPRYKIVE